MASGGLVVSRRCLPGFRCL
nr:hypothetical protein [Tanacetum cinerariifolium]